MAARAMDTTLTFLHPQIGKGNGKDIDILRTKDFVI